MEIQMSMFSDPGEDELREILRYSSHGWESSKLRIYAAYQTLDAQRFEMFLADEFGISGHSIPGGFVDFRGYGIEILHWDTNEKRRWSWKKAAKIYAELIAEGWPGEKVIRQYEEARKAGKGAPMPGRKYWEG